MAKKKTPNPKENQESIYFLKDEQEKAEGRIKDVGIRRAAQGPG